MGHVRRSRVRPSGPRARRGRDGRGRWGQAHRRAGQEPPDRAGPDRARAATTDGQRALVTYRSGFAAVLGRPNVGKSTLVNRIVGTKVTITSPRPNTTRAQARGVLNPPATQAVFVDPPGLHRPRTALGERLNDTATSSLDDVDVVVTMVDATGAIGPGDRMVLAHGARRGGAQVRSAGMAAKFASTGDGSPEEDDGSFASAGGSPGEDGGGVVVAPPALLVVVNKIDKVDDNGVLT